MCKDYQSNNDSLKDFSTSVVVDGVSPLESVIISEMTSSKTVLLSGHVLFGWLGPVSSAAFSLVVRELLISSTSISLTVALVIFPEKNLPLGVQ